MLFRSVALDPDPSDDFIFRALKYSENEATVDGQKLFRASKPGNSVLLFSEIQRVGRGQPREFLRVRVVQSKEWNSGAPADSAALIGQKITDPELDKARLGTGFIRFDFARYNPFIYDVTKLTGLAAKDIYDMTALRSELRSKIVKNKAALPGPVIPVNLHPSASATNRIVVVWYDDPARNDG